MVAIRIQLGQGSGFSAAGYVDTDLDESAALKEMDK
jgi:hypothetical protein